MIYLTIPISPPNEMRIMTIAKTKAVVVLKKPKISKSFSYLLIVTSTVVEVIVKLEEFVYSIF
jgi:hypothetical protein